MSVVSEILVKHKHQSSVKIFFSFDLINYIIESKLSKRKLMKKFKVWNNATL